MSVRRLSFLLAAQLGSTHALAQGEPAAVESPKVESAQAEAPESAAPGSAESESQAFEEENANTQEGAAPETEEPQAPQASEAATSEEGEGASSEKKKERDTSLKLIGVPVPGYNPQIQFSLGLIGMATYHLDKTDEVSPRSSTALFGLYSTNNSGLVAGQQQIYWGEDNNRAALILGVGKINSEFYGTGDATSSGLVFPLGSAFVIAQPRYLRRLWNRLYLGAQYQFVWNEAVFEAPEDAPPEVDDVFPYVSEQLLSGVGPVAEFDSRDSRFSPTSGFYVPLNSIFYAEAIGSDATFGMMDFAVNYYHAFLSERLIVASRGFMSTAMKDTPAHLKPAVGRGPDLRGYAYGRYRDNLFVAAQAEVRWYFWWKFGAVAFAGVGTATSGMDALFSGPVLPSYGTGLRFMLHEEQRMVMRVDYARGNEDGQFYFSVSEAF